MDIDKRQGDPGMITHSNGHRAAEITSGETNSTRDKISTGNPFLTVVLPAYNEEQRLPVTLAKVLEWAAAQTFTSEVVVVDDGSEDNTVQLVQHLIAQRPENEQAANPLKLIANEHRGKGYTVRSGMLAGQGQYILFSDADLSTPIEDFERLLPLFDEGYDVVIGSREGQDARRYDEPFYRHLMGRVFNLLVRLVTFSSFQDTQCGFKAFTREAAHDLFGRVQLYGEGSKEVKGAMVTGFDVEVLFLARKRGYRVREVPVRWYHVGGSKVNPVKDSLRMVGDILTVRLNDLRGMYKEKPNHQE